MQYKLTTLMDVAKLLYPYGQVNTHNGTIKGVPSSYNISNGKVVIHQWNPHDFGNQINYDEEYLNLFMSGDVSVMLDKAKEARRNYLVKTIMKFDSMLEEMQRELKTLNEPSGLRDNAREEAEVIQN